MEQADDAAIMRASRHEPERFGVLFERHHAAIWSYLARSAGRDAADDLAGQVFVAAFRRRATYDERLGPVRGWLYGIATNVLRTGRRTDGRRHRAGMRLAAERGPADLEDVLGAIDDHRRFDRVRAALDGLPALDREVLLLYAWDELTYAEIAAALGIEVGTVRSRLSRARARLRELVDPTGQVTTDG